MYIYIYIYIYIYTHSNAEGDTYYRKTSLDGSAFVRAEEAVKYAQMRLQAAITHNASLSEDLASCGSKSKKSFLMWDEEHARIFGLRKENEALVLMRTQELALATDNANATEMQVAHEDCAIALSSPRSLLAIPYSAELPGERTVGIITAHPSTGAFLRMGKYHVQYMSQEGRHGSLVMDFMRASECVFREGQLLHLHLDSNLYAELTELLPNMHLPEALHAALQEPGSLCDLEVFYVLDDSKKIQPEGFGHSSCMRVGIDTGEGIVVVFVSLFRVLQGRDGADAFSRNVTVRGSPHRESVDIASHMHIVDKSKPHIMPAMPRKNGASFWR